MNIHRVFYEHPNVLALVLTNRGDLPNADRVTVRVLDLIRALGISGDDLATCHQMIESHLIGSHIYDLGGAPHHLTVRYNRRRRFNDPEIDASARTLEDVERLNVRAFEEGLDALLDRCELIAKQAAPKR